ncbi:MAG TPA: pyocin knob domain-containing protein [Candidatus Levilactobacillus faecigallinarum]|uniref:Pyocin knob domain-containing protein n=1 Tax=Candidatus Levilactobacillus faecigallinarum TaxID=2838638 RepID=A0A9D1U3P6_9LACO|nr:pyocin knob domain-containing protein [Candidatus Levilactobacillus faecigallinarum]
MNYKSSMTDVGNEMIAQAHKDDKAIIFDSFLVSEALPENNADLTKVTTDLFSNPLTYPINSKATLDNTFTVKAVLANKTDKFSIDKDFSINTIGILAHIDGDTDSRVMTVAAADGIGAVITAFKDTLYSLTIAITQAYKADQPVKFVLANVAYALASDLDKLDISINARLTNYYTKPEADDKFVTNEGLSSKLPTDIAHTGAANTFTEAQKFNKGATDGDGNSFATEKDVSKKVDTADTTGWQKQALFGAGSYTAGAVPTGSDYATYVKANFSKPGVYFIRDDKTASTIDGQPLSVVDSMLTSEGGNYYYASGVSVYGDSVYRAITPTSDTGWKRSVESRVVNVNNDGKTDANTSLISMSQKLGIYSVYIQGQSIHNPSTDSIRGILHSTGGGFASGTFHSNQGDAYSSYSVVIQNGTTVTWKHLATTEDITPSSMRGRDLTGNDDIFTLAAGLYPMAGVTPKNGIPGVTWGWVQVVDNGNKFVRWFDVNGREQINTYLGSPAHWSGWRATNSSIVASSTNLNTLMLSGTYMLNGITVTNLPSGLTGSQWLTLYVNQIAGSNGTQILINSNTGQMWTRGWHASGSIIFTAWVESVMGNSNGTITVNGQTYAPVAMDVNSKSVSAIPNFVNGFKLNGHLININPTNGWTVDGVPLISIVADEATAKSKSLNDLLHFWVTKE